MYVYGDIITDGRVNRAANALSDDYEVTVISTNYGKPVDDDKFRNVLIGNLKGGVAGLLKNINSAFRLISRAKPSIVYCHDYYSAILAWLLLHLRRKIKVVYDAHELIISEKGYKDRRQNFFYWFEKHVVRKVDLLICAKEERGNLMMSHYHLAQMPLVIKNISKLEIDDFSASGLLNELSDFFAIEKKTIVYAGVLSSGRGVDTLIDAVYQNRTTCKLLVIGGGPKREDLQKKAAMMEGLDYSFTGKIPYKFLGSLLSRCDVGYVHYPNDTLNNIYCASNKVYEYASVALPIVANTNPTIKCELSNNGIGISSENLSDALKTVLGDLPLYRDNCKRYSVCNPWENEAVKLLRAVDSL